MTYGIEARNSSGELIFDSTSTVGKYLTTIQVPAGDSGSYTDPVYSEIYGVCIITGHDGSILSNFGTLVVNAPYTVSWSSRYGAVCDPTTYTWSNGNISTACAVAIFARI